jgi:hypothetical protein
MFSWLVCLRQNFYTVEMPWAKLESRNNVAKINFSNERNAVIVGFSGLLAVFGRGDSYRGRNFAGANPP